MGVAGHGIDAGFVIFVDGCWLGEQHEGHGQKAFDPFDELVSAMGFERVCPRMRENTNDGHLRENSHSTRYLVVMVAVF